MASKGQKFKRYPLETKKEILSKYSEGRGYKSNALSDTILYFTQRI